MFLYPRTYDEEGSTYKCTLTKKKHWGTYTCNNVHTYLITSLILSQNPDNILESWFQTLRTTKYQTESSGCGVWDFPSLLKRCAVISCQLSSMPRVFRTESLVRTGFEPTVRAPNTAFDVFWLCEIGIFESPKCDSIHSLTVTRGIGPLVGRTSRYRRSVMHVLAVILSINCHFFFICQNIFIRVIWSARKTCPLLMDRSKFLVFWLTTKIRAQETT